VSGIYKEQEMAGRKSGEIAMATGVEGNVPMTVEVRETEGAASAAGSATRRVLEALAAIEECGRPEVWISLRGRVELLAEAAEIDRRSAAGEELPLAGTACAVKDNIDVAGLETTAACPEFAYRPAADAPAVARLRAAGAVVLGKTNLDQFATGLVGTRSPYGAVRNAAHPEYVSGGSSSGSAVAVALGIADFALGTDTAGSGRVPAALGGIVGIKPTLGLVPTAGVVPACADFDAVTVFAAELPLAARVLGLMAGPDDSDPRGRRFPADAALSAPTAAPLAVPREADLAPLSPAYREAWARTLAALEGAGFSLAEVDISPLLVAARLLYDGALVAERFAAVGEFLAAHSGAAGIDPTVAAIVEASADKPAHEFAADLESLRRASAATRAILEGAAGLLLPTTTEHPRISEVEADPVGINKRMGTYTNFLNLLDLSGVAVPGLSTEAGMPFGVTVVEPAFGDQIGIDLGARVREALSDAASADFAETELPAALTGAVPIAVFGAHLRGAPLHHELEAIGARFEAGIETAPEYRLFALDTVPPKPGLVRVAGAQNGGASIGGELYAVSPGGLGAFLSRLPAPMALTEVELAGDRSRVTGFTCTHDSVAGARDITEFGSWPAFVASAT